MRGGEGGKASFYGVDIGGVVTDAIEIVEGGR